METTEQLRKSIKGAKDLESVVKTMKGIAAVSIRQYGRAVESLRDYTRAVRLGFRVLLHDRPELLQHAENEPAAPVGAVVFGSDQGMAGPLNRDIATHAMLYFEKNGIGRGDRVVACAGLRACSELEAADIAVRHAFRTPGSAAGITGAVQELLVEIDTWRLEGVGRVCLFHPRPANGASYGPVTTQLLPLDRAWLRETAGEPWPTKVLPMYTMGWDALLAALVRQYIFITVFQAFAESLASEHASRLVSMQSAEKNIGERIEDLQKRYHQRRQASITEELLDVVSGFEALEEKPASRRL